MVYTLPGRQECIAHHEKQLGHTLDVIQEGSRPEDMEPGDDQLF